jgi:hypothetical protein
MNQLYFTINLNKHGELKQQEDAEKKTFVQFTIFFAISAVLLYSTVLFFHYGPNFGLKHKLQNRQNFLSHLENEVKYYQTSGEYLSAKDLERLATTSTDRVFWARKLVALSEEVDQKLAVTHFSFKNGILSLHGITRVEDDGKEFDLIDDFIRTLRANPNIAEDFPEIKFVRSNRDREKDADIIRFQIDCMKQAPTRRGGNR